jgi:hypothetical protein
MSTKSGSNRGAAQPIDLTPADPNVVRLINNLQEQIYVERETNKRLKGG